jgi:hypothetical protein
VTQWLSGNALTPLPPLLNSLLMAPIYILKADTMKKKELSENELLHFLKLLLPEGKIGKANSSIELKTIVNVVSIVLETINRRSSFESIFNAFQKLSYPLSVVEPVDVGTKLKPYISTNSHAIFIGVDVDVLTTLKRFAASPNNEKSASHENRAIHEKLMQFKI